LADRIEFPFGVYDTNLSAMLHIGLYSDEKDCWKIFLGWPGDEEIEDAKKRGLVVLPLIMTYSPPETRRQ
jgi:hypothetical protein